MYREGYSSSQVSAVSLSAESHSSSCHPGLSPSLIDSLRAHHSESHGKARLSALARGFRIMRGNTLDGQNASDSLANRADGAFGLAEH